MLVEATPVEVIEYLLFALDAPVAPLFWVASSLLLSELALFFFDGDFGRDVVSDALVADMNDELAAFRKGVGRARRSLWEAGTAAGDGVP